jgi:hypothetical protein
MFKLSLREDTRQGHLDLAKEHLKSGQARIAPAPSNGEEKAPTGADIKRKPLPTDQAAEHLGAYYLSIRNGPLNDLVPLSKEQLHRSTLGLQLKSTIPYYLDNLFERLGINSSGAKAASHFTIAEPLNTAKGDTRGHYTPPFSVIDESGNMKFMQHSTSTLLHEVVHALGKLTFSFSQDGNSLHLSQAGLSMWKRLDPNKPAQNRRLFGLFDEALSSITQADFLVKFMGFESTLFSNFVPIKADSKQMLLNGQDILPALQTAGIVTRLKTGEERIQLPYERLYQGNPLSDSAFLGRIKNIGNADSSASLTPDGKAAYYEARDRQYLYHDSSYAVLSYHIQILAQELWPRLGKQEAQEALHSSLLLAQVSGDLKPLTRSMKKAFGENAGLYVRALASINQFENTAPQICAFAAFVKAGNLPPDKRDSTRKLLATAILNRQKTA